jgi:hypothetical protein
MLGFWRGGIGIRTVMYDSRRAATFSMVGRFNTQLSLRTEFGRFRTCSFYACCELQLVFTD